MVAPLVPKRLTLARESAGLTKTALAAAISLSPAAVSHYELGRSTPSPGVLARLAFATGVTPEYLSRTLDHHPLEVASSASFRRLRAVSRREQRKVLADLVAVVELVRALDDLTEMPSAERLGPLRQGGPVVAASSARELLGVGHGAVDSVTRTFEAAGGICVRYDAESPGLFGVSGHAPQRPVLLLWDAAADVGRIRFTLAHEIGHVLLHSDAEQTDQRVEAEADAFASQFLLPPGAVDEDLPTRSLGARGQLDRLLEAQQYWGVSIKALLVTANRRGMLPDSALRRSMTVYNAWDLRPSDGVRVEADERPTLLLNAAYAAWGGSWREASTAVVPASWLARLLPSAAAEREVSRSSESHGDVVPLRPAAGVPTKGPAGV